MEFEAMKKLLDETLDSLIGQRITDVQYVAIDYSDNKPHWDFGEVHEVEHGVQLTIGSGKVYQISWDNYENDYGVYITRKELRNMWNEEFIVMWNVTEQDEWANLLNQEISEIKAYWHEWNNEITLQDVEFELTDSKKVWFSAARYEKEKDQLLTTSDDISIIFEEPVAFRYKTGIYTDEKNLKIETYKK